MENILKKYIPEKAVVGICILIRKHGVHLKIVKDRKSKYGDYRQTAAGIHQITINQGLNPYRFLITLVHEIAHLVAYKHDRKIIKPHGAEWKFTFQQLMDPFLTKDIFPADILKPLSFYLTDAKASTDRDSVLAYALRGYDKKSNKHCIFQLHAGNIFRYSNGKAYKIIRKRIKKYECLELATKTLYVFGPNAEVEQVLE